MIDAMMENPDQQDFFTHIRGKRASTWQWAPGIDFVCRQESLGWALALSIERQAQCPDLFSDTLKRRFDGVESYDGYYICLDSHRNLVVWHELNNDYQTAQLQAIVGHMLALAGLKQ